MIGRVFMGRYEVQRLIGEGGMGQVYLARSLETGRQVVVKVMHEHIALEPKFRERFARESELIKHFHHPNCVTYLDANLDDPLGPCLVMDYIKGVGLDKLLEKNKRLAPARVGRLIRQLCGVLQDAHEMGMVHRDLKPSNIMILDADTPRESVKVMDFGLAKMVDNEPVQKVTDTNVDFAVGTPGYICPEQVRGEEMDHRGDLYSVGVIIYELLTGQLPFPGPSSMDMLLAHATEYPPTFADLHMDGLIAPPIEQVVFACLAKSPDDRPQSARELSDWFDNALMLEEEEQPPPPAPAGSGDAGVPPVDFSGGVVTDHDPAALTFFMEAWMPQTIALLKLRGFIHDAGGEVVDSVPGLIRVRVHSRLRRGWFGLGRGKSGKLDIDLRLHAADPRFESKLFIETVFRPATPSLLNDSEWRDVCTALFVELRSYLLAT